MHTKYAPSPISKSTIKENEPEQNKSKGKKRLLTRLILISLEHPHLRGFLPIQAIIRTVIVWILRPSLLVPITKGVIEGDLCPFDVALSQRHWCLQLLRRT